MINLEKIGLGRKKKGYFPDRKVRAQRVEGLKNNPYVKALIILTFLGVFIVFMPGLSFRDMSYKLGDPWRDQDLNAPFTFSLLKDRAEIDAAESSIRQNTPPIFYHDSEAIRRVEIRTDSIFRGLTPVLESYLTYVRSYSRNPAEAYTDSIQHIRAKDNYILNLSDATWNTLLDNYARLNIASYREGTQRPSRFIGIDFRVNIDRIFQDLFNAGIIDISKSEISASEIYVRDSSDRTQRILGISTVRDQTEAREAALFMLNRAFNADEAEAAFEFIENILVPNYLINTEETQMAIQDAIQDISPTKGAVTAGQVIIRKGDLITEDRLTMLLSLEAARTARASDIELWQHHLGNAIIFSCIFLFFLMYLFLYRNPIFDNNAMLLLVLLAIGLVLTFAIFIIRSDNLSIYMVPMAIAPIILTIIFDSRVGLMTTMTIALAVSFMSGNNFEFAVAAMTGSSIAVYSVRDIKNRSQFFLTTPALVFLSYALILLGFTLIKPTGWDNYYSQVLFLVGNAILIWLSYPLILLFEKLFKVTTEVSLLELNNNNHPLLKELMVKAPGTFQHSLQVANLAEAASSAIGANALLARVGALYHDIGKTEKPEYFVENQFGDNEHDKLKPRMSALVIKNHVSAGVKMAEEAGLPDVIIDFIRTHHGTSIIKFFFDKAKKSAEKGTEVREEDFKYDGPLPNTKETGILLLADTIEAASRAMSEPSYQKLEGLVGRLIDEKVDEGQLNNCSLTFQDLRIIKENFLNILVGIYHSRIKYPGQDDYERSSTSQSKPSSNKPVNMPAESD
jgi:putative nucleotidyltransferase with HDIG domain